MKRTLILLLFSFALVGVALAQQPAPTAVAGGTSPGSAPPRGSSARPTSPGALTTPTVVPDAHEARELPLDSETFDVRVHRRVTEYGQRHEQRERRMSSYDQASGGDPGLGASPIRAKCKWN